MVEPVVNSTTALLVVTCYLSEAEIMLLIRPRTLQKDIIKNEDLISALEEGRLYATIDSDSNFVELFASHRFLDFTLFGKSYPKMYSFLPKMYSRPP